MKPGDKVWRFDSVTQTIECGEAIPTRDDMIATTIEQSKRLLNAGYSPQSADMCYQNYSWETDEDGNPKNIRPVGGLTVGNLYMDFPAWSLSSLWDISVRSGIVLNFKTDETTPSDVLIDMLVQNLVNAAERKVDLEINGNDKTMGQYTNNVILDRIICESHDRWVTRTPDYYDDEMEEDEDNEGDAEG